jgi:hypothetical protein
MKLKYDVTLTELIKYHTLAANETRHRLNAAKQAVKTQTNNLTHHQNTIRRLTTIIKQEDS